MFRSSKKHFIEGMRNPLAQDAQETPPVPCEFAVGDRVTFTNDNGVQFFNRVVTGFSPTVDGGRFVYFDNDAWWFSVNPSNLTKQSETMGSHREIASALATKYGFTAPNDYLLNEYESYAKNVAEGDPMEFDDWLAGSDPPEIVQARNAMNLPMDTPRG